MNSELIDTYKTRKPEGHFFDAGTMRFFKSRVGPCIWAKDRAYFVTSERGPDNVRRYSARILDLDGGIHEIGKFQQFKSSAAACRACEHAGARELTGMECQAGRFMLDCIAQAKGAWESAGGTITDDCRLHRRNADHWAKIAGLKLEWHSIAPGVIRANGESLNLAQFAALITP